MIRLTCKAILGGFVFLALAPGITIAEEKDEKVEVQNLPAAVAATIAAEGKGANVVEAEIEEENGQKQYSIDLKNDKGEKTTLEIALDGKLLKVEKEDDEEGDDEGDDDAKEEKIEVSAAPAAVQATLSSVLKEGSSLEKLVSETDDGVTVYEADYKVAGSAHSVKIGANGSVLEQENETSTSTLPAEVSAAVKKAFPNGQISVAEEVTVRFFELEIKDGTKTKEIKIFANGKIEDDEEGDHGNKDGDDDEEEDDDDGKAGKKDKH